MLLNTEPGLRLHHVTRRYGSIVAVNDISLEVSQGEFLVIVGPSGCGKTTLLRLVAGLDVQDEGSITIQNRIVSGNGVFVPPEKRRVGLVFQDYALFPHMTIAKNVAFGLHRWSKADVRQRVYEMLDMVQLTHLADRYPHELSGGERQRVALARALAPKPDILLLDEPFSNLDAGLRTTMREHIQRLLKGINITTFFVTHDQEEALLLGDRVAVMNRGQIEQVGTPEQVFHQPATYFVAEFFGYTAFISGHVTSAGLETELGFLAQYLSLAPGSEVNILVRPDDLAVYPDEDGTAYIARAGFQGMHCMYQIALPSGHTVYSLMPHTSVYAPGTRVRVELRPGHDLVCFPNNQSMSANVSRIADHHFAH